MAHATDTDDAFVANLIALGIVVSSGRDRFRCCQCGEMQERPSILVWIPDDVPAGATIQRVVESTRAMQWEGHAVGWCVSCCRGFRPEDARESAELLEGR